MTGRAARATVIAALAACLLALPSPALATFHLVQVREVYPGSAANPNAEYVELEMWSSGQNLVGGHFVRSYDAAGAPAATSAFPDNVANAANQSTMLLATPQAEAEFGIVADAPLPPAGQLLPTGGAVCWETIDCLAWGSFSGSLPSPAGTPAAPAAIPDGMALRRAIGRGCPTALDSADDSDQSQADFEAVFPSPRPNSVAPGEKTCSGTAGGGGEPQSGEHQAPKTTLRRKPPGRTADRTPTFRFTSSEPGSRFECKLDRKGFRSCASPFTVKRLALGAHRFQVRAVDREGTRDPTPAAYGFRIIRPKG
ncbi:MAG TPA: hypothetical protein VLK37_04830 [Solirubrobacterales bacterium]|nr:hypothetical protein [Solirubrobacterales bacterium]